MPAARSGGGPRPGGRRRSGGRGHDAPVPGSPADDTPDADPESVARMIALRKLTTAPRTRAQLTDALARSGVPDDVTRATLDRFEDLGLVDDEDFARQWARTRQAGRGLARRALAHELRQRGVEDEVVRNALDDPELDDELETARAVIRRRVAASGVDADRDRQVRRLLGLLARKGYGFAVSARAVRDVLGEVGRADLDDESVIPVEAED